MIKVKQYQSAQFSRSVESDSLRPHGRQHARPPCPSPTLSVYSNSCPLSRWYHPAISSSVFHSPPTFNLSQHQGLFKWVSFSHQVAKVLEFQLQHQSFQWWFLINQFSHSVMSDFATPWTAAHQASLSITNSWSPPKPMPIESVMPSNHLILCRPLLLLPSIFPSIRIFSNESALRIRWPKDWSFSFNISPSNEHPGLISFRMDWLDLLAVQETLKSLLQHHSSKASILRRSAFFIVQLSHLYKTTEKKP